MTTTPPSSVNTRSTAGPASAGAMHGHDADAGGDRGGISSQETGSRRTANPSIARLRRAPLPVAVWNGQGLGRDEIPTPGLTR